MYKRISGKKSGGTHGDVSDFQKRENVRQRLLGKGKTKDRDNGYWCSRQGRSDQKGDMIHWGRLKGQGRQGRRRTQEIKREVKLGKTKDTGETLQDIEDRKHEENRIKEHDTNETRQGRSLRAVTGEMRNTVETKFC